MKNKSYIGDGVYAHWDGANIWLTTLDDQRGIALNSDNWSGLIEFKNNLVNQPYVAPPGITVIVMDLTKESIEEVHSAIADAVREPPTKN